MNQEEGSIQIFGTTLSNVRYDATCKEWAGSINGWRVFARKNASNRWTVSLESVILGKRTIFFRTEAKTFNKAKRKLEIQFDEVLRQMKDLSKEVLGI